MADIKTKDVLKGSVKTIDKAAVASANEACLYRYKGKSGTFHPRF